MRLDVIVAYLNHCHATYMLRCSDQSLCSVFIWVAVNFQSQGRVSGCTSLLTINITESTRLTGHSLELLDETKSGFIIPFINSDTRRKRYEKSGLKESIAPSPSGTILKKILSYMRSVHEAYSISLKGRIKRLLPVVLHVGSQ